jgi:hypothetical protein
MKVRAWLGALLIKEDKTVPEIGIGQCAILGDSLVCRKHEKKT